VGFFLSLGIVFGLLAAATAYLISYHEYRQRMLQPHQNPRRMALEVAGVTFVFFVVASFGLYLALGREWAFG
jgi:hypothetical protein